VGDRGRSGADRSEAAPSGIRDIRGAAEVARTGKADVGETRRLVTPVLPVVIGDCQLAIVRERLPLPPLICGLLLGAVRYAGHLPWVCGCPGEAGARIFRDADHNVVVAGTWRLDPSVGVLSGQGPNAAGTQPLASLEFRLM